eukprot:6174325-Pleurochrysis_carterae.AAC.3
MARVQASCACAHAAHLRARTHARTHAHKRTPIFFIPFLALLPSFLLANLLTRSLVCALHVVAPPCRCLFPLFTLTRTHLRAVERNACFVQKGRTDFVRGRPKSSACLVDEAQIALYF